MEYSSESYSVALQPFELMSFSARREKLRAELLVPTYHMMAGNDQTLHLKVGINVNIKCESFLCNCRICVYLRMRI
jgi:hypothetical protein